MPDLEPITREEMFLDGQDLEPITRKEMFIKRIYDKTQVIPEPITREEIFLKKAGDETTDVTIEQLTATENRTYSEEGVAYSPVIVNVPQTTLTTLDVTENGTYTAPSGTAYDEVEVDVPLPDNAYLLKDIQNTPCDIAAFSDGANLPMPSLKVSIEPVQSGSGDPSPENIRPISGWSAVDVNKSGVDVWDEEWEVGSINGSGQNTPSNSNIRSKNYIPIKGGKEYYFVKPNVQSEVHFYDKNKTFISYRVINPNSPSFTALSSAYYIRFVMYQAYGTTYNNDISINYPSTDTEYHAYNGHTITIPFTDSQGNPITVYGGTLDVVSGVLTLTHEIADLPSLSWGKSTNTANIYFYVLYTSGANGTYNDAATNVKSNIYTPKSRNSLTNVQGTVGVSAEANALYIADGRFDDYTVAQFKEAVSDVQLLLPLATPIEIQLTPTQVSSLMGVNNVWADCGDIIDGQYFSKEV